MNDLHLLRRLGQQRILIVDNNAVRQLGPPDSRDRLRANLRVTGRELWPTTVNISEALKSRDREVRRRMLNVLHALSGNNFAITLPSECLRRIAEAIAQGQATVDFSDAGATRYLRDPDSIDDEDWQALRQHMDDQERSFAEIHERAREHLRPMLQAAGGRERWPTASVFLEQVWTTSENVEGYVTAMWGSWGLPGAAPLDALLQHPAWRLFFDGWGYALYRRSLAHPQPPSVGSADLQQLIYLGISNDALLATDDAGLQVAARYILPRRYPMRQVVSLDDMTR